MNAEVIQEADGIQQSTKAALYRMWQQTAQTEEQGVNILSQMREQRHQSHIIQMDADNLNASLNKSNKLLNSFDWLTGNWRGRRKKEANIEATEHIAVTDRKRQSERAGIKTNEMEKNKNAAFSSVSNRGPNARIKVVRSLLDRAELTSSVFASQGDKNPDVEVHMGLDRLVRNDNDIDAMFDQMSPSLDRLEELSMAMREETQSQCAHMDKLTKLMKKANTKQAVVNSRTKRNLMGRWLNRAKADKNNVELPTDQS